MDYQSICQPRILHPSCHSTSPAGYHPHLHGPADHSCHRQPQGEQTKGLYASINSSSWDCLIGSVWCYTSHIIILPKIFLKSGLCFKICWLNIVNINILCGCIIHTSIYREVYRVNVYVDNSCFALQKGSGYHLDLFVIAIQIMVCSLVGTPWFVAATVLSINHVRSLSVESECSAPGERPKFLGVR